MHHFNIIFRELRANFKSLLIWSAIVILFTAIGFSKFSAFYQNPELLSILDSMPPALISAFSMNAFNLTTVTGFFGIMAMYFNLMLAIAAAMWGSDIISKEERDKTVEFSLTLPVTRRKLVTSKIVAAALNCLFLLYVTYGSTLIFAQNYQPEDDFNKFVFLSLLAAFLIQLVFLALGVFLGCAMKKHKRAGSAAVSILLVTYFLSIMSGLDPSLEFLRFFSPFQFFNPALLLRESGLQAFFFLVSLALVAVFLAGAYYSYSRRDLYI